jgi:hypothetical protein
VEGPPGSANNADMPRRVIPLTAARVRTARPGRYCESEARTFPREVIDMALARRLGDRTERAMRGAICFAKRRALIEAWAAYPASEQAEVVPMRAREAVAWPPGHRG